MARINLLNWREEKRKQIEQQFYTMLVAAVLLGAGIVFAGQMQLDAMIKYQESRNNYLKSEIKKVEKAIAEIKDLEKKKKDLLDRMQVIQKLQGNRSDSVHMLDELVQLIPEGIHLTRFEQKQASLTFDGLAQSNARVSAYMRNIERAEWLKAPNLLVIKTKVKRGALQGSEEKYSEFKLTSKQGTPDDKKKAKKKG